MGSNRFVQISAIVLAAALASFIFIEGNHRTEAHAPITVRWLLSHQPTDVFTNATSVFSDVLSKESGGSLALQVISPSDVGYARGDIPNTDVFHALDAGTTELASAYTVALGQQDPAFWAVNMPFLFSDYDSANAALESPAAAKILSSFTPPDALALAFTMSGGFRIIATKNKPIHSLSDLAGLRIATSGGPIASSTLAALGAIPVPIDLESGSASLATLDGVETTYTRLGQVVASSTSFTHYLNETDHSMFLTAILVSKPFYNSLSPQNQKALRDAAAAAARVERQDSIAFGERAKAAFVAKGSVVTTLSPDVHSAFVAAARQVYDTYASLVGSDTIQALRSNN